MERNERLPIPNEKISLFKRIYNNLFAKKAEKSEISKIADKLSLARPQEPKEDSGKEFVPDKRTAVYDFFENDIPEGPFNGISAYWYPRDGFNETVEFENLLGNIRSFSLIRNNKGSNEIHIDGRKIFICTPDIFRRRDIWGEMVSLVRYNDFINKGIEKNTFVNELGRIITEISEKYDLNNVDKAIKAGDKLYKELGKNPIYVSLRKSFEKANKEYVETHVRFRNSERDRKEGFDKKNAFAEEIKVEGVPEITIDEKVETKEKDEVERED